MWPFKSESKINEQEKIDSLEPGESWAKSPYEYIIGGACSICSKKFHISIHGPYSLAKIVHGNVSSTEFGKYKPRTIYYCRTHSNKEIEEKIKELDV